MDEKDLHKELFEDSEPEPAPEQPRRILCRSKNDFVITGLCGGISKYFNIDTGTVRVSCLLSLLLGNWPVILYLIAAFLLPVDKQSETVDDQDILRLKKENAKTVLSGILMLLGLHFAFEELGLRNSSSILILPNGFILPVIAIATGVFLISNKIINPENMLVFPQQFFRSSKEKMISGVCGGLAAYLNVDTASLRIIVVLITCLTLGLTIPTYIFLALKTPKEIQADLNE